MPPLINYVVGNGPRGVLLLHGFLGSGRNLTTFAKRLAEREPSLRIVVPDLTGHGASPPLPPGADLATMADDVLATARATSLAPPLIMIGHSMGGRVGLRAKQLGGDVAQVVLLDITPSPIWEADTESAAAMRALLHAPEAAPTREIHRAALRETGLRDALVDWLLLNLVNDGGQYRWRFDRAALATLHPRISREDLWAAVDARVSCIRGGRAPYVTAEDVRRFEAAGARVDTIEEAGHFVHVDALPALLDLVHMHVMRNPGLQ